LCEVDAVEKVETMPSLFGNKRSVFVGHRDSFRRQ
jgi:hypothetical protein